MSLHFLFPACFLLLIPVTWMLYRWRNNDIFHSILRALILIVLVSALAQPRMKFEKEGGVLVVVADRSKSMPPDTKKRYNEILKLLHKEKGDRDMIAVVGFSDKVNVERMPSIDEFDDFKGFYSGDGSRLTSAIDTAVTLIPKDRHGRILVLSDGRYTDMSPLDSDKIGIRNIPIDYRYISRNIGSDLAIMNIDLPPNIELGEAFQFRAEIFVPERTDVSYRLKRDNHPLYAGKIDFSPGKRQILFQDRLVEAGNALYTLEITSPLKDPVISNNFADAVVSVIGNKPLLHVGHPNSRLLELAENAKINIVNKPVESIDWSFNTLSKYRAVILENIPASKLGYLGQDALKQFVESSGGGLMITGGRNSFGIGGYYKTPVAEVLPVSMELRREHRKLSTAVVVVLDRSGSMSIHVPGGRKKMDLANQGTASVLELLSNNDALGVLAVDSQAHIILNTKIIGGNRSSMEGKIRSIQSMGGGIFVYEGLSHAAKMLIDSKVGTRHIILFSDAADSEEPGEYKKLLKYLRENNITVSVIGMGTDRDCDAELLKDIAVRGGGNIYFSNSAMELPQLFAQETLTVFRGAFVEEPTQISKTDDLPLICNVPEGNIPPLGGFNLCYLRPNASIGLVSSDDYKAPILSFWNYGNGRVLAFTGEIDGKFTGEFGKWGKSGQLLLSCIRWINHSTATENDKLFVTSEKAGSDIKISVELDPDRENDPFIKMPRLVHLAETEIGIVKNVYPLEWKSDNSLGINVPIDRKSTNHFFVELDEDKVNSEKTIIPCTSYKLPYSPEYRPEFDTKRGYKTLSRLGTITNGKERLSLENIFREIPPFTRFIPIWHYFALLAIVLLLFEVAYRRLGFNFITRRRSSQRSVELPVGQRNNKDIREVVSKDTEDDTFKSGSVLGALAKAKDKGKRRTK